MDLESSPTVGGLELGRIAQAAYERSVAEVNGDDERSASASTQFEEALHGAVSARVPISAIAAAEQAGQERAKDELRREVLRGIERGAKQRRNGQAAYEVAVRRGGRLGLGNVEMASAAAVTHAAIRKLLERSTTGAPEDAAGSVSESQPQEWDQAA
jgi:hypothetical protein